jgi:hypothetical protein
MTEADALALLATVEEPPPPLEDTPPATSGSGPTKRKRPTTRAGRAAASAAASAKADSAPKNSGGRPSAVALSVQGIHELLGGLALPMAGMPNTGQALVLTAKDAGKLWGQLAKRYPSIERIFSGAGDGALVLQLLMVYLPVIMAAVNERRAPGAAPGLGGMDLGTLLGAMGGGAPAG